MAKECKTFDLECLVIAKASLKNPTSKLDPLINENNRLISMFVTSIKTASQKGHKPS
jgi:hypothetical protein